MESQETFEFSRNKLSSFFDVDATSIIETVTREAPKPRPTSPTDQLSQIQLVSVHTFIVQGHIKAVHLTRGILVPTFASHWGVVVGDPGQYVLYHLVFSEEGETGQNDETTAGNKGKHREVEFHYTKYKHRPEKSDTRRLVKVGETKYSDRDLMKIGDIMIKAFGNYHCVFWNCQTFAKCFLQVICGPEASAKFDSWTLSEASNLFLCAFMVGAPLATTKVTIENKKMRDLLEEVQSQRNPSTEDIKSISDEAIDILYQQASTDPVNMRILNVPAPGRHSKGFLDWFFDLFNRNKGTE